MIQVKVVEKKLSKKEQKEVEMAELAAALGEVAAITGDSGLVEKVLEGSAVRIGLGLSLL